MERATGGGSWWPNPQSAVRFWCAEGSSSAGGCRESDRAPLSSAPMVGVGNGTGDPGLARSLPSPPPPIRPAQLSFARGPGSPATASALCARHVSTCYSVPRSGMMPQASVELMGTQTTMSPSLPDKMH